MASMEVSAELKLAKLKKDNIRKTLDNLQSQSSSLLLLTVQLKDLQDHFDSVEKLIQQHSEEFESKQKHFDSVWKSVEDRSREVESKEKRLESSRKWVEEKSDVIRKWREERAEVVEAEEKRLELMRKSVEERSEEVESKTSRFESVRKMVQESVQELGLKEKKLELLQKSLDERSQVVDMKEKDLDLVRKLIEDRSKEVEMKEKEVESERKTVSDWVRKRMEAVELKEKQLDVTQKSIEERSEEVKSKENRLQLVQKTVQETEQGLELKEKKLELLRRTLEGRSQDVEWKEKSIGSVQKSVEECCKRLKWKEENFETFRRLVEKRSKEVGSKEKQLDSMQDSIQKLSEEVESKGKHLDSIQKSIEERWKEVELKKEQLGSIEKSNEERCKELEMKEKQIDEMRKVVEKGSEEFDLKKKEFNSMQVSIQELSEELVLKEEQLETVQKLIEEGHMELELKEKQLNSIKNLIDERSKEFSSKERELDSIKKSIAEGVEKLKLQEKQCNSIQFSIEENSKELEFKERKLKLIRETIKECLGELQLKEKQFDSVKKSIEDCLEELKSKEKQLESIQKKFDERSKGLQLKEKQFESIQKSIEECGKELNQKQTKMASNQNSVEEGSNIIESQVTHLRVCITMKGKSLQLFLNKHLSDHESLRSGVSSALRISSDPAKLVLDAMQGFYPPHSKDGDVEFEASVIRRSCILLLEQLTSISPLINAQVKEEAVKLAGEWRRKIRLETLNSLEVLGFLQLLATYGVASAFDAHDLLHLLGTVAQYRQAPELRRALGLADKIPVGHILHPQVKIEQSGYVLADNPTSSSSANCDTMDGTNMLLALNDNIVYDEVFTTLRMSLEPAKLVLDVMREFYSLHIKKGGTDFKSCAIGNHILLLEQLMRISPEIEPHVKEEAMKLAVEWKAKMRVGIENSLQVFVFLQLLAAYGLVTAFKGDEILKLLVIVAQHRETPNLCQALGFEDKIPDFIELLVEKRQWLEAIRYSFAFQLVDKFQPPALLEAQLKFCREVFREIDMKGNPTHITLAEAAEKEAPLLRAVIKCIADYKLESVCSPVHLEKRLAELEKHKAESNHTLPAPSRLAIPQQQIGNKRPLTVVSAQAAPNASVGSASAFHSIQPPSLQPAGLLMNPGAKYSRTSTGQRGAITPHLRSLHGPPSLATTPPIRPPMSLPAYLYGPRIGTNVGARQFGFAGTHPGTAANLGSSQFGLASTSGGNGLPPQDHPFFHPKS
ncbi:hypothetical protein L1049_021172 [Liquidambar formosana]|uniref:FRIGIDA-like protein n=1 Tax=Liquidambar formosana TaxID=63359 RepID=A0AAP0XAP1_LIQFO